VEEIRKKAVMVVAKDLWSMLGELGVKLPDNCCDIIIEARVGDVVRIYYACFAGQEEAEAAARVILRVDSELADEPGAYRERAERAFAAYWKHVNNREDDGWKEAWDRFEGQERVGWYLAVQA
jgi:hypothetical protein